MKEQIDLLFEFERPVYAFDYLENLKVGCCILPSNSGGLEVIVFNEMNKGSEVSYTIDGFDEKPKVDLLSENSAILLINNELFFLNLIEKYLLLVLKDVEDYAIHTNSDELIVCVQNPFRLEVYDLDNFGMNMPIGKRIDIGQLGLNENVKMFSLNNHLLFCTSNRLIQFDRSIKVIIAEFKIEATEISSADIDNAGNYFAYTGKGRKGCFLLDLSNGKNIERTALFGTDIKGRSCVKFLPKSNLLALATRIGYIMITDIHDSFKMICNNQIHSGAIHEIRFSNDDQVLYTAGFDGKLIKSQLI